MGRLGSGVKSMGDAMTKVCHATGQEKFESWSRSRRRRRACALISGMSLVAAGVLGGAPAASGVAPASDGGAVGTAVGLPTSYTPPPRADLSGMTWQAAFKRLNDKMFREYAFTEWKGIQWQRLYLKYQPRIARAQATNDRVAYYLALREYTHELRDGHVGFTDDPAIFEQLVGGGFGLILTKLDDGAVVATWIKPGGPAARAGIRVGARVVSWGGEGIDAATKSTSTVLAPQQPTDARTRYEQLRFLVRGPVRSQKVVSFLNPQQVRASTVRLTAVDDHMETLIMTDAESIFKTSGWPKKMVEYRLVAGNIGYVRINAEIDLPPDVPGDHTPTLQQFRMAITAFNKAKVAGVIVDVRSNSGGSDQMVADFMASFYPRTAFYEYQSYIVPTTRKFQLWVIDEVTGEYVRPGQGIVIKPGIPHYNGPVVALVNNGCVSSGEGVAMGIKRLPQGKVVGFTGTNGSFGMVGAAALMPGGFMVGWPFGQSLDRNKVVQLDSRLGQGGVLPTNVVPMTWPNAINTARGQDVVLAHGVQVLRQM